MPKYRRLRLILGDQLNHQHSWFREKSAENLYVLMEILPETNYARHHVQKVVGFFLAMRAFAGHLKNEGHEVAYFRLDDPENEQSFEKNCQKLLAEHQIPIFSYQLPDEWRVDEALKNFSKTISTETEIAGTEHFLTERDDVKNLFSGKKTYLMETFYRKIRQKHDVLMEPDGKTPLTGQWNYDAENRKKLPKTVQIPPAPTYFKDEESVRPIVEMLEKMGVKTIGNIDPERFNWPTTRAESLDLLAHFVRFRLSKFGDYEDAMTPRDWVLFHSRLSFSMNIKLLSPLEVVEAAIDFWKKHPEAVPFSSLEGFVRQIVGWREYMRGIYWAEMPRFATLNFFGHEAPLPDWFWTGETRMHCLGHSIKQSLDHAYAHHIQRLMVTGAFSLLLGVHPDEVDKWYLGIYMDAIEWVEITNTRGMSQFADGGIVGTKPYVGSANYLNKMSDYCGSCFYKKELRHGENACPFNSLYWDFYDRHREKLAKNPRIGMAYKIWDSMDPEEKVKVLARAHDVKTNINQI